MPEKLIQTLIENVMKDSYLDYSMSVIVGRALPDVRDGLKPVHRRILYSMWTEGLTHDKKFTKCAGVVGDVLKYFHPHGDTSVYDALVRLAQSWTLRYTLVQGQGNFGCFTADTKVKLADGRSLSFLELIEEFKQGKRNFTFTVDEDKKIKIAEIKSPRLTKTNAEIMKVILDNGEEIKCTLNHLFMLKDGTYREAQELRSGDSLMPSYFRYSTKEDDPKVVGYEMIFQPNTEKWNYSHVLADEWNIEQGIYPLSTGRIRHHLDFNKLNNNPLNIQRMNWKEHWQTHYIFTSEKHKNDASYRQKLAEGRNKFWLDQTNKIAYSQRMTKTNLENWKNEEYHDLMSKNLSEINKKHWAEHPELKQKLAEKSSILFKKLWADPKYKKIFHEKIVASNKKRTTNLTGKKKFLKICSYLLNNKIELTQENFENIRKEIFGTKSFTSWNIGINKYFENNKNNILFELNKNHKVFRVEFLNEFADVYDLTIEGSHNFALAAGVFVHNSQDGDPPAAYRYTESRLNKIAAELLRDIEKETVNFIPNFDGSTKEPTVLPAKLPNLLINGSSGIAVGMATNIPPHNIKEIIDAIIALIENPETDLNELMKYVKGPDFPTGSTIIGTSGIRQAYKTGKGRVVLRSKYEIEDDKIIITEIPYQLNKSLLIEEIAKQIKDKVIEGISDLRDESDRDGMRFVIELKKGIPPELVLNQLYKHSQLQTTYGINIVALVDGQPLQLGLKECLEYYIEHRKEVVTNRTRFDLRKAEERDHILQGLLIALESIDKIISLIKKSKDTEEARNSLITNFTLSEIQANAILDMKLSRLAALEQQKILNEHNELLNFIEDMKNILSSEERIKIIIKDELIGLKNEYGDERKTIIIEDEEELLENEDLIEREQVVITATHSGYFKRQPLDVYKSQNRGGKGIIGTETKDDTDFVEHLFIASSHSFILLFTDKGMVHWLKAYQVPESGRYSKGTAIVNLAKLEKDEKIAALVSVDKFEDNKFLLMSTKSGIIKKTKLSEYGNPRQGGIIAINLRDDDKLIGVNITDGTKQIIIATKDGRAVRFKESDVREVGRNSIGVRGINIKNSEVVGMQIANAPYLLTVTEKGYGKRTEVNDYRLISRGGSGVTNIKITEKNGKVVKIKVVNDSDELMLISKNGVIIRTPVEGISVIGRNTQGVRIMNLDSGDSLATVETIINDEVVLEKKEEEFKPSEDIIVDSETILEDKTEVNEIKENELSKTEISENISEENTNDSEIETSENNDLESADEVDSSGEKPSKKDFTLDGYENVK